MNLQKMTADLAALARAPVCAQTYLPAAAQGTLDAALPPGAPMAVPDVEQVWPEFSAFANAIGKFDAGGLDNIIAAREEVAIRHGSSRLVHHTDARGPHRHV